LVGHTRIRSREGIRIAARSGRYRDVNQATPCRSGEYRTVEAVGGRPVGEGGNGPGAPAPGRRTSEHGLESMLAEVAKGDHAAFRAVYDQTAAAVLGTVRRVLRDPAQSEEVMQEVLLEVWRTAARFDASVGSANAWIMTLAHRRAVDRVRSEERAVARELRATSSTIEYDEVSDAALTSLEHERVRRCLSGLTDLQRESVTLAYYGGYSYREVAQLLGVAVGTVKTRMRDGLIRLRDCLGVDG
jgi:RNA polymerase sigma-70 factor, ECF subfamily